MIGNIDPFLAPVQSLSLKTTQGIDPLNPNIQTEATPIQKGTFQQTSSFNPEIKKAIEEANPSVINDKKQMPIDTNLLITIVGAFAIGAILPW